MARRRYYRRPVRVVAAKKKWATNMKQATTATRVQASSGYFASPLVANSTQTTTPTPVILKTGNFKIQGDCSLYAITGTVSPTTTVTLYVVYLPECVQTPETNYATVINDHPEWIMAWKMLDFNIAAGNVTAAIATGFSFSSRLKRNLNSGDSVKLVAIITNAGDSPDVSMRISYGAQYWTCCN